MSIPRNKLLIYGYIRENEVLLKQALYFPYYLKDIIVLFAESNVVMFCLHPKMTNTLFIGHINNERNNMKFKAKIIILFWSDVD